MQARALPFRYFRRSWPERTRRSLLSRPKRFAPLQPGFLPHQKNFALSWPIRGSRAEVTWPNWLLFTLPAGLVNWA
jgi:hypothetical protein